MLKNNSAAHTHHKNVPTKDPILPALLNAITHLTPKYLIRNPVMFVTYIGCITYLFLGKNPFHLYFKSHCGYGLRLSLPISLNPWQKEEVKRKLKH